jgi:hypothetical protein
MKTEPKERKPWEQQSGEPKEDYSHFLAYRNLGPGRSIDAAYFLSKESPRSKRKRTPLAKRASGKWCEASAKWNWTDRAVSWDIEMLEVQGRQVVTMYFAALQKAALRILTALDDKKIKPKGWQGVLDGLHELSNVIPPETVAALRAHAGGAGDPGGGRPDALPPPATDEDVARSTGVDRKK